ncbi:DnaJ C-terminal domain-containing protein [Roseicella frigidaeris]|uniref:DnaJ C-terminal domain-containing protein n=1 Tax=Roseicella frigidaeris TaxID=2230885 RepID=UPI001403AD4E|nr:DnaJ C-terminal domain-containing protein [Roseicella frigidaeris]
MDDPYQILGVPKTASAEEIRKAYRRLAKQWHPDTNPDKPEAEARFKAISAANALLSDPEQRGRFDRGEIDASGAERAPPGGGWREWAEAPQGARYQSRSHGFGGEAPGGSYEAEDFEDLLSRAFGAGARAQAGGRRRGADIQVALHVPFLDAVRGATRQVTLPDGRRVNLTIPKGAEDGTVLRLAGQGMPGRGEGAPAGDILAVVEIEPHPLFRREGKDILLDLPVTLQEALLGARVEVPTIEGPVTMTIPPYSGEGTRLRLRGRGVDGGHQIAVLHVVMPKGPDPALEAFLRDWKPQDGSNPRAGPWAGMRA